MKLINGTLLGMGTLGMAALIGASPQAMAQAPFQITRPQNNATVRETVRIQMPRNSVPENGYLALSIDGKFRIALAVPPLAPGKSDLMDWDRNTITLLWDTKTINPDIKLSEEQRVVEDGPHTLQLAALDPSGKRVGTQRLSLNVSNRIPAPADGVPLVYALRVGDSGYYAQHTEVEYLGGRDAPAPPVRRRRPNFNGGGGGGYPGGGYPGGGGGYPGGGYPGGGGGRGGGRRGFSGGGGYPGGGGGYPGGGAPMDAPGSGYPGGGGGYPSGGFSGSGSFGVGNVARASGPFTLPVQIVDARYNRSIEESQGGAYFIRDKVTGGTIQVGAAAGRLEAVYDLKSRYRTVTNSGRVVSYGQPSASKPGAYIALPLVDLGGGRRRVGQKWRTRVPVLLEWATLDAPPMVQAENTLVGLEWQDGYQTARILQTFKGQANIPIQGGAGEMRNAKVEMERTIWFGYKPGKIIRMETTTNVDGEGPAPVISAMVPGLGGGGGAMGSGYPGGGGGYPGASGDPDDPLMGIDTRGLIGGGLPGALSGMSGASGSLGGVQQQAVARMPAKFRSVTTVTLGLPGTRVGSR